MFFRNTDRNLSPTFTSFVRRFITLPSHNYDNAALNELRKLQPDIIHANELNTLEIAVSYKQANQKKQARIIYDSHEFEAGRDKIQSEFERKNVAEIERNLVANVDSVITVSEGIADTLEESFGYRPNVIFNAPSFDFSKSDDEHWGNIRKAANISDSTPLAVYVGRLKIGRGQEIYLEALRHAPTVHLAMVGVQPPQALYHMELLIEKFGLEGRVHFVQAVQPEHVPYFVQGANFGIVPTQNIGLSYRYAMPNKLFEMTLAGLPVIVGRLPEMQKYVEKFECGIVVDERDPIAIGRAMDELAKNGHPYKQGSEHNLMIHEGYSWQAQKKRLIEIYTDVVGDIETVGNWPVN